MQLAAGATIEVLDSDDNLLQKLTSAELSSTAMPSSSDQTAVNSTGLNSAGMQSMTSNVTEGSTSAACNSNAYLLPLQLGQNEFEIEVAPPEFLDEVHCCTLQLCVMIAVFLYYVLHHVVVLVEPVYSTVSISMCRAVVAISTMLSLMVHLLDDSSASQLF